MDSDNDSWECHYGADKFQEMYGSSDSSDGGLWSSDSDASMQHSSSDESMHTPVNNAHQLEVTPMRIV